MSQIRLRLLDPKQGTSRDKHGVPISKPHYLKNITSSSHSGSFGHFRSLLIPCLGSREYSGLCLPPTTGTNQNKLVVERVLPLQSTQGQSSSPMKPLPITNHSWILWFFRFRSLFGSLWLHFHLHRFLQLGLHLPLFCSNSCLKKHKFAATRYNQPRAVWLILFVFNYWNKNKWNGFSSRRYAKKTNLQQQVESLPILLDLLPNLSDLWTTQLLKKTCLWNLVCLFVGKNIFVEISSHLNGPQSGLQFHQARHIFGWRGLAKGHQWKQISMYIYMYIKNFKTSASSKRWRRKTMWWRSCVQYLTIPIHSAIPKFDSRTKDLRPIGQWTTK